ncbi:MFS transporter [Acuticoccus mangrovi]|uniref:MFS transporter n=1 Tax=Acuticoccus mangrovi TaxID=2796142 RepID=A0A934ITM9_9HYPH|nr:MFS transporter [Acuticoccus mangrovi]MBJ3778611.1 MFS transporter [Acuticoccus mangrovi]
MSAVGTAAPSEATLWAGRHRVVSALGVTQILAWGSSYYLLAVLARPIAEATGWRYGLIVGGLSLGLLVSGLVSVRVGRLIDRYGGRPVLVASTLALVVGLLTLAAAPNLAVYFAAWLVLGFGMGAGLYDAAFSTLGRLYGMRGRGVITTLTLWGGFASTIAWPLSAFLVEGVGWRGACVAYAVLHLLVTLPLQLFVLPKEVRRPQPAPERRERRTAGGAPIGVFLLLAAIVTTAGAVSATWSVHLITILEESGLPLATAVGLAALVGPAQVGARVVEMLGGGRYHPIWTMTAGVFLVAMGIGLLFAQAMLPALALMAYGAGNGVFSIARGTLPLALFGAEGYARLMGRLAMPSLIAQALAPAVAALAMTLGGAHATLALLLALAAVNAGAVLVLVVTTGRMRKAG